MFKEGLSAWQRYLYRFFEDPNFHGMGGPFAKTHIRGFKYEQDLTDLPVFVIGEMMYFGSSEVRGAAVIRDT